LYGIITVYSLSHNATKNIIPMSGRGDNNKSGSSGQGASNQSEQGMKNPSSREKSNTVVDQTGGDRSEPQSKTRDQSSNRNENSDAL
jgi:hypothetical protein